MRPRQELCVCEFFLRGFLAAPGVSQSPPSMKKTVLGHGRPRCHICFSPALLKAKTAIQFPSKASLVFI